MARVGGEDSFSSRQRASSSRPDDELHVLENGDSRSDRRRVPPPSLAVPEPLMTGSVSQGGVARGRRLGDGGVLGVPTRPLQRSWGPGQADQGAVLGQSHAHPAQRPRVPRETKSTTFETLTCRTPLVQRGRGCWSSSGSEGAWLLELLWFRGGVAVGAPLVQSGRGCWSSALGTSMYSSGAPEPPAGPSSTAGATFCSWSRRLSHFFFMLWSWASHRDSPVTERHDSFLERFRGPELKDASGRESAARAAGRGGPAPERK
ncbi:hypothetical protein EYF80_063198 [Liparis tanakae]|uniref:Uncharacterized protein n=1 Tax=Liparis tanakae TaxID=230148 RepID=A0A4Z2ECT2_9TELE|nr:hypothetical protein EYF80_063198 [Liparis tanakae]